MPIESSQQSRLRPLVSLGVIFGLPLILGLIFLLVPSDQSPGKGEAIQAQCQANLATLKQAKEAWAAAAQASPGAEIPIRDFVMNYMNGNFPVCPAGGRYQLNPVGVNPSCQIVSHVLP
jgi:hypothetical protein